MTLTPNILTPKEPLTDQSGQVTRSWWRFFNILQTNSGSLSQPVTIAPNPFFTAGEVNSGSTITVTDIPAQTILGNGAGVAGPADAVPVGAGLTFLDGDLQTVPISGQTLSGNPSAAAAAPTEVFLDTVTIFMNNGTLSVNSSSPALLNIAPAEAIATWGL